MGLTRPAAGPLSRRAALARYGLGRLAVFLGVCVVLAAVGLRGFPLLLAGLLLSSLVGLVLLRRQREAYLQAVLRHNEERAAEQARLRRLLDDESPG